MTGERRNSTTVRKKANAGRRLPGPKLDLCTYVVSWNRWARGSEPEDIVCTE